MGNPRLPFVADATFHIYNHAVGDEDVFRNEDNYNFFMEKISQWILPFADVFAYCLMGNHFHLLIRIKGRNELLNLWADKLKRKKIKLKIKKLPEQSDSYLLNELMTEQFSHCFNSYVQAYNKMFNRQGTLLKQSFQRRRIDSLEYMIKVICYIHNNPVNDGFAERSEDWKYSSYNAIASDRKTKVMKDEVIGLFGDRENFIYVHKQNLGAEI